MADKEFEGEEPSDAPAAPAATAPKKRGPEAIERAPSITFRCPAGVLSAVDVFGASEFCDRTAALVTLIQRGLATIMEQSPRAQAREREKDLDIQIREAKLARELGNIVTKDQAELIYLEDLGVIRTRMQAVPQNCSTLAGEQIREVAEAIDNAFHDLRGDKTETWDDLAKDNVPGK